ncbi:MAG: hypothetical protein A2V77_01740 [Anaeromyxobacter sp. RBG_16_69_14]|nr:MAG: hypothetical protein A2V77_01740 [Anaeromyxobacter sp. RBG_16_69_14]
MARRGDQDHEWGFREWEIEKEHSRREDERALASGQKSREQLRRENGHFAGIDVVVKVKAAKRLW